MQGQSVSKLIIACGAVLLSLYVVIDVMTSGGNAVGRIYAYLLVGSAIYGLLAPRGAFVYLMFLTAYLDLLKRFMIFDSGVSSGDLYNVLGIAPATLAGMLAHVAYSVLEGKKKVVPGMARNTFVVIFGMAVLMAMALVAMGRSGRAFGEAVNTVCYLALFAVVPYLYQSPAELQKMLKWLMLIYIPSAIYMLNQSIFGLADWEMAYVRSGLTIEIRQLQELRFRPFGTLSSAAAASTVFGLLAAIALLGPWGKKDRSGILREGLSQFMRLLCFLLFTVAASLTITRTGWVQGIIAMGAVFMFSNGARTKIFYALSSISTLSLIFFSNWFVRSGWFEKIEDAIRANFKGDLALRSATIGTFAERLQSFDQLTSDASIWTPLGYKMAGKSYVSQGLIAHDAISEVLIKFGYLPLGLALCTAIWLCYKMHRVISLAPDSLSRRLGIISAACFVGSVFGCLSTAAQLSMFPANFLMWFFPSIILSLSYSLHTKIS